MRIVDGAVLAVLLASVVTCGGSPTSPAISPEASAIPPGRVLSLQAGTYALDLIGFGASLDPEFPPCDPPALQGGRTAAWTPVQLDAEQNDWVARTSTGSLEFRFRQTGDSIRGFIVSGSISGNAADAWGPRPPSDRGRVFLLTTPGTSGAVVQGVADRFSPFLSGKVSGDIRFTNNQATAVSRCTVVMWILQPLDA
jgi:hypothetical protein